MYSKLTAENLEKLDEYYKTLVDNNTKTTDNDDKSIVSQFPVEYDPQQLEQIYQDIDNFYEPTLSNITNDDDDKKPTNSGKSTTKSHKTNTNKSINSWEQEKQEMNKLLNEDIEIQV